MNLQTSIALLAALAAAFHLLRGPLASLLGAPGCPTGGCSGCASACPMRQGTRGKGKDAGGELSPGRLP